MMTIWFMMSGDVASLPAKLHSVLTMGSCYQVISRRKVTASKERVKLKTTDIENEIFLSGGLWLTKINCTCICVYF